MTIASSTQPSLKARVLPRFPANVIAGDGIQINRSGGAYTFSLTRPPPVTPYVTVNIKNDNSTDDSIAIQAAINSLGPKGGEIILIPPENSSGPCVIKNPIIFGDGAGTADSTRKGIRLRGPASQGGGIYGYSLPLIHLVWGGAAGQPMFTVHGPLEGWGLHDLMLNGNNVAAKGMDLVSARWGNCSNLVFANFTTANIYCEAFTPYAPDFRDVNCLGNSFYNMQMLVSGTFGIVLTGNTQCNSCYNAFYNTTMSVPTGSYGIYLQACDNNFFFNTHIVGSAGMVPIMFDYAVTPYWPADNMFFALDMGNGVAPVNNGTPNAFTRPNKIYGMSEGNGGLYADLENVCWDGIQSSTVFARTIPTRYQGMQAVITDSTVNTWGSVIAGGGANKVLAAWNGTNWTVIGK